MDVWKIFEIASNSFCILFAVINILLLIPNCMVTSPTFKVLSPNISIFTRCILFTLAIIPLGSLIFSIFLLTPNSCHPTICLIIYWITNYAAALVRITVPVYMIDGLIATIFYSKYYKFTERKYGYIYLLFTYTAALFWTIGVYFGSRYYIYSLIIAASIEITTLILWNLLYFRNKKLHKILRFQANLKIRSQIITNIKTLRICLVYNFLFSFFPLICAIVALLMLVILKKAVPASFMFLGYNFCITVCMIIRAKRHWHTRRTTKIYIQEFTEEQVKIVLNALGKALPASDTIDTHFYSLQRQWN